MSRYHERVWASPALFIATALVIPASLLVFFPIDLLVGIVVAGVLYAGCVLLLIVGSPAIDITDTELRAGNATLPLSSISGATAYRGTEARAERGPRLDARAWLSIRGWVDPVVRIQLDDADDPTPYWLLSTRRPEEIVQVLDQVRAQ